MGRRLTEEHKAIEDHAAGVTGEEDADCLVELQEVWSLDGVFWDVRGHGWGRRGGSAGGKDLQGRPCVNCAEGHQRPLLLRSQAQFRAWTIPRTPCEFNPSIAGFRWSIAAVVRPGLPFAPPTTALISAQDLVQKDGSEYSIRIELFSRRAAQQT